MVGVRRREVEHGVRLHLAESSARAKSSQADLEAMETRNLDAMMFDTWFDAWVQGDAQADAAR